MTVTKIEELTKAKLKVELDGEFAFVLYKKELSRFGIREDEELPEETYQQIRKDVILKRAKLRAMHLLTDMARTESGLREKLRQGLFHTKWPGRFEVIAKRPLFIADGAHNEDAAKNWRKVFVFYFTNRKNNLYNGNVNRTKNMTR